MGRAIGEEHPKHSKAEVPLKHATKAGAAVMAAHESPIVGAFELVIKVEMMVGDGSKALPSFLIDAEDW